MQLSFSFSIDEPFFLNVLRHISIDQYKVTFVFFFFPSVSPAEVIFTLLCTPDALS